MQEGTLYGAKGLAAELAQDEIAHVRTLQGVLEGSLDLACPQLDLGPAFVAAAEAAFEVAGVDAPETKFNPFLNDLFFLHGAFIFEDVGVTGYLGAAAPASRFFDSGACLAPLQQRPFACSPPMYMIMTSLWG